MRPGSLRSRWSGDGHADVGDPLVIVHHLHGDVLGLADQVGGIQVHLASGDVLDESTGELVATTILGQAAEIDLAAGQLDGVSAGRADGHTTEVDHDAGCDSAPIEHPVVKLSKRDDTAKGVLPDPDGIRFRVFRDELGDVETGVVAPLDTRANDLASLRLDVGDGRDVVDVVAVRNELNRLDEVRDFPLFLSVLQPLVVVEDELTDVGHGRHGHDDFLLVVEERR